MISEFEKRYNALRSAYDMNRSNLEMVGLTLEVVMDNISDDHLKQALNEAITHQNRAINEIGLKCGYEDDPNPSSVLSAIEIIEKYSSDRIEPFRK